MIHKHTIDLSYGLRHALRALRTSLRKFGSLEEIAITRPGRYAGSLFSDELSVIFEALCCLPGLHTVTIDFDGSILPVFLLRRMLEGAMDLNQLNLLNVRLSGDLEDFEELEHALGSHDALEGVRLVDCKVGKDGSFICDDQETKKIHTKQIPRIFCRPRNLQRLWLQECHDSHIVGVAQALEQHQTKLKELSILSSKIGDPGVESIARMLKTNTTLEELNVTLFRGHALRVAESVHDSSTLKKLTCNILIPASKPALVTDGPKRI